MVTYLGEQSASRTSLANDFEKTFMHQPIGYGFESGRYRIVYSF